MGQHPQAVLRERAKLLKLESVRASLPSVASALKAWHAYATLLLGMTPMSITLQEGQEGRTITLSLDGYLHQQLRATRDTPSPLRVTLRRAGPQLDPRAKRLKKKKKKPSASGSTPSAPKPAPKPKKKKKKKVVPVW